MEKIIDEIKNLVLFDQEEQQRLIDKLRKNDKGKTIVECLVRKTDIIFRYGGEEFVVILTETPIDKAVIPLERFRKTIEDYPFFYDNNHLKVTVSVGVETLNPEIFTSADLFGNADKALYNAK